MHMQRVQLKKCFCRMRDVWNTTSFRLKNWDKMRRWLCSSILVIWCNSALMLEMQPVALTSSLLLWKSTIASKCTSEKLSHSLWATLATSMAKIASSSLATTTCHRYKRSVTLRYKVLDVWCRSMVLWPVQLKSSQSSLLLLSSVMSAVLWHKTLSNSSSSLSPFVVLMINAWTAPSGSL